MSYPAQLRGGPPCSHPYGTAPSSQPARASPAPPWPPSSRCSPSPSSAPRRRAPSSPKSFYGDQRDAADGQGLQEDGQDRVRLLPLRHELGRHPDEEKRAAYDWNGPDAAVAPAPPRTGVQPVPLLIGTPKFVKKNADGLYPPTKSKEDRQAGAVVRGRGRQALRPRRHLLVAEPRTSRRSRSRSGSSGTSRTRPPSGSRSRTHATTRRWSS